jgi:octaprenyl-diphosphate synthase
MVQPTETTSKNNDTVAQELSVKAKFMLELTPIAHHLGALPEKLIELLPYRTKAAEKIADHIFKAGGKRVRPSLFLLCCEMTGYTGEHLLPVAAVSEYVHTASLLHDDVVDESYMRRGAPTANAKWGNQASVLVGDLVYATACEIMATTGKVELVRVFAEAIRKMSDGELLQMENAFEFDTTVESYLEVLEGKTGVLIGASCAASGILTDSSQEKIDALYNFGNQLGIAFQLIDDALDYSVTDQDFGKPTVADILEGKLTYPVLKLKELATDEELKKLEAIISSKSITDTNREWISSLVSNYGTTEHTLIKAREYTTSALNDLKNNFEQSESRNRIERIANLLLERKS